MQLRIGICSSARISNDFVTSLATLNKDHYKVVAVAATNLESAKKFAEKFNIERAYGSYHELAKDANVDLVYVGTRNHQHYAAAKLFIEHKKHCLVEKPMTIEIETTKELFELGRKNGVFVMEALWSRWVPAYQKIREIIKSGQIGEIVHIQSNFVMSSDADRVVLKKYGGGVSFDIGVYGLNTIFEGVNYAKPKAVQAHGRLLSENGADLTISANFDFPGLTTATMLLTAQSGKENLKKLNHALYLGTKGYIKISDFINNPGQIEVNGQIILTPSDDGQTGKYNWNNSHGLRFQLEEARKCLMENKLQSEIHGEKQSLLLIETITKLMADVGYDVKGVTERDTEFKHI